MKNTKFFLPILLMLSYFAKGQDITFHSNSLYPEGTAFSKKQQVFFVSSLNHGQIGKLDFSGNYTPFIQDPELIATVGILADDKRDLLYVTNTDNGVAEKTNPKTASKLSEIIAYDLHTGKRKFKVDLGALNPGQPNFVNDLTIDNEGNLYVTNSFSPILFKIDKNHKGSIFAKNDAWTGAGYNLNGIVYNPDGYLIVAQSNKGLLYKIDIKNPSKMTTVKLIEGDLRGADGLILNGKNELAVISHVYWKTYRVISGDNWSSAEKTDSTKSILTFPTTGVLVNGKYYILNAKVNELFDPKAVKTDNFMLQEVKFK